MTDGTESVGATDTNSQPDYVARVKDQNMINFLRWYLYKLWTLYIS